jgi:hypothetical protein
MLLGRTLPPISTCTASCQIPAHAVTVLCMVCPCSPSPIKTVKCLGKRPHVNSNKKSTRKVSCSCLPDKYIQRQHPLPCTAVAAHRTSEQRECGYRERARHMQLRRHMEAVGRGHRRQHHGAGGPQPLRVQHLLPPGRLSVWLRGLRRGCTRVGLPHGQKHPHLPRPHVRRSGSGIQPERISRRDRCVYLCVTCAAQHTPPLQPLTRWSPRLRLAVVSSRRGFKG